jgi:hypothetical protein
MKIEEGKYYRRRDGEVVGPMVPSKHRIGAWVINDHAWYEDGRFLNSGVPHMMDLISEVYVSDTPPADAPAPKTIRLDPHTEWKLFRQMGPHELVTNASVPMLETKTLRDEFAMAALTGFMADPNVLLPNCDFNATAEGLYAIADAMMEARKK